MTDEQMRIAVAMELGWTDVRVLKDPDIDFEWPAGIPPGGTTRAAVSDYPNSRDDCAEFEATLTPDEEHQYVKELMRLIDPCVGVYIYKATYTYKATARQRCEAFLRTRNRWNQ